MRRLRGALAAAWPFLAAVAVAAVVVAATVAIWSIFDQRAAETAERERVAELAADVREIAVATKEASEANRALLEDMRRRDIERQPSIDAAIARIVNDNAEAHAALLGEIARLVNRPVPAAATPRPVVQAPATAPRAKASSPPRAPAAPPTTAAPKPAPTTTTCPARGKRPEHCK